MKSTFVSILRFLGFVVWTAIGALVGGLAGAMICANWVIADVTRRLPPPRDATFPMVVIWGLGGAVLGAALAQVLAVRVPAKYFPVSGED
jgi:hypothetical protein